MFIGWVSGPVFSLKLFVWSMRFWILRTSSAIHYLIISILSLSSVSLSSSSRVLLSASAMSTSVAASSRNILVTGGNRGIGKAICERLLREWSDTHIFLGARDVDRGNQALQDIVESIVDNSKHSKEDIESRLSVLQIDAGSDASVQQAVKDYCTMTTAQESTASSQPQPLYGIINNAGVGFKQGLTLEDTINVNYFGPRRVNDAFLNTNLVQRPGGRIVNMASASGPNFMQELDDGKDSLNLKKLLHQPWLIPGTSAEEKIQGLDEIARQVASSTNSKNSYYANNAYGASKALLNAYTVLHGKQEQLGKDNNDIMIIVNSVTPGFILTDMTAGLGASNSPSQGAVPPCFVLMDDSFTASSEKSSIQHGRYYGSDCKRSPLHYYRGPGEPVYEGDEDVISLEQLQG